MVIAVQIGRNRCGDKVRSFDSIHTLAIITCRIEMPRSRRWCMAVEQFSVTQSFCKSFFSSFLQKTLSELDEESEEMPTGWNMDKTTYSLRYKYKKHVFVLIGTVVEEGMIINLLVWASRGSYLTYTKCEKRPISEWNDIGSVQHRTDFGSNC